MAITVWVSALILGSLLTCFLVFSTTATFPLVPAPTVTNGNASSPADATEDRVGATPSPSPPSGFAATTVPETVSQAENPQQRQGASADAMLSIPPTSVPSGAAGQTLNATIDDAPIQERSRTIADAAMRWLEASNRTLQLLTARQSNVMVVDYGARPPYPMPEMHPRNWTWLTAPLPPSDEPTLAPWPDHRFLWAPSTAHRLLSLSTTMNFFTLQLLVRLDELLAQPAMANLSLPALLGATLGMASHTLLLLPCGATVLDEVRYVHDAIAGATAKRYTVGLRQLSVTVEALHHFSHGSCQRSLLHVAVKSMLRGVRHYWCFHTARFKHKFDLKVKVVNGETTLMVLKRLVDKRNSRNLAHAFIPSINFAELLGWGLERSLRRLLLFDMLRFPNHPDPFPQNWLLAARARSLRIDTAQGKNRIPPAQYIAVLQTMLCLTGPLDTGPPECSVPCRACLHFRFVTRAVPPETCHVCAECVRQEVLRARPFLSGQDWAPDCDQVVNASDIQVGPDEHRCHPFTALTVHARDLLSPDTGGDLR